MADENEELRRRKLAAAAEHSVWVADQADATVLEAERKVEKARADLNGARDALEAHKQQAKEARADADTRRADAEREGADLSALAGGNETKAQAQSAGVGGRAGGR